jgi:hypothetical protein
MVGLTVCELEDCYTQHTRTRLEEFSIRICCKHRCRFVLARGYAVRLKLEVYRAGHFAVAGFGGDESCKNQVTMENRCPNFTGLISCAS